MDLNAVEQLKNVLSSMSIEKDQIIYEEGEPLGAVSYTHLRAHET